MVIEGTDRPGLERLLRYCARPPFALEHLQQLDAEHLVYHSPKSRPERPSALVLTPLELIDKIAALVPPPRTAAVGGRGLFRTSGQQSAMGSVSPAGTGGRIRSAHCLVMSNFFLVLGTVVRLPQKVPGFQRCFDHFLPLRVGARRTTGPVRDAKTNMRG